MANEQKYTCKVCGFHGLDEPPFDDFGCGSFAICPCCGTEFGYDDCSTTNDSLRRKWILSGMKWWSNSMLPPLDFDPFVQLKNVQ